MSVTTTRHCDGCGKLLPQAVGDFEGFVEMRRYEGVRMAQAIFSQRARYDACSRECEFAAIANASSVARMAFR